MTKESAELIPTLSEGDCLQIRTIGEQPDRKGTVVKTDSDWADVELESEIKGHRTVQIVQTPKHTGDIFGMDQVYVHLSAPLERRLLAYVDEFKIE